MPLSPTLQYRIPHDSPLRYLPLVYFLLEDTIAKCPTLRALPRCFGEVSRSEAHAATIQGDAFLSEIMDAVAALAFPHFGFGGWKEHYTGYFPVWQLSYSLLLWAPLLESETGWGLQRLFQLPPTESLPFFDSDYIKVAMRRVVARGIAVKGWKPILDVVREMPCEEDFEPWNTNVRKDFLRKWYHTRSKRVQMVSLESCLDEDGHGIHEIADASVDFEERIVAEDYVQRFKARLSEKDMRILELRVDGYTYEEIAGRFGYKNHSGVIKRIQSIARAFEQYRAEQQ